MNVDFSPKLVFLDKNVLTKRYSGSFQTFPKI